MRSTTIKLSGLLCLLALAMAALGASNAFALPETSGKSTFSFTSAEGELTSASGLAIKCKSDKGSGETTSSTELSTTVSFEGCKVGGVAANSLGDKGGVILLANLPGKLCYINASTHHVGVLFKLTEPIHIEVKSLGVLIVITGSVVGLISPVNTSTKEYTLTFAKPNEKCEGASGTEDELFVELEHNGEKELGTEVSTEKISMTSAIEIIA